MKTKISEGNKHFFLYAKSWYQETDCVQDCMKILEHRSGINTKHLHIRDLLDVLTKIVIDVIGDNQNRLLEFISLTRPPNWEPYNRDYVPCIEDYNKYYVKACMYVLRYTSTDLSLSDIDNSVLKLSQYYQDRLDNKENLI